ncbi:hypothetical protein I6F33_28035 [Bradyrhizobium sp. BRP20]|uniref:hypothetical protein n=1 Tax=Bradyrhizobium sp. BRP20 TaxID=2793822 RepID=UPI001CD36BF8|nr:hypothetical protein [Bradyrhizobium sp. BRP20]MCA1436800.1 hypothetical protein [Bradyrhizobium sp. BRP20]
MKIHVKIAWELLASIRADLRRRHAFAHERVGFLKAGASMADGALLLFAIAYQPVADDDYERDPLVGARIGGSAMRKGLQFAYQSRSALLHVHAHGGRGRPEFSGIDLRSGAEFVPGFFHAIPRMPHGMIVLSNDSATAKVWLDESDRGTYASSFTAVGAPLVKFGER